MRRTLAALSIVLACVLPAAAVATWWAYGQATDTARFTTTARPLASDATVQRDVVDELVAVAGTRLAALPVGVAGGASAARTRVRAIAEGLVQTSAYRESWLALQRTAHARLVARLTGDVTAPLTLDLAPIAAILRTRVAKAGLTPVADAIVAPAPVTLLDRSEVRRAQRATDAVRIVRGIAIPGAVLALLGVLLTAPGLAPGLLRTGLCVGVSTLLLVAAGALVGDAISSAPTGGALRLAVYDVLTKPLHGWVVGGVVATIVLAGLGAALIAATRPVRR